MRLWRARLVWVHPKGVKLTCSQRALQCEPRYGKGEELADSLQKHVPDLNYSANIGNSKPS